MGGNVNYAACGCKKDSTVFEVDPGDFYQNKENNNKEDHIAPFLSSQHRLSDSFRVGFKLLLITFKA